MTSPDSLTQNSTNSSDLSSPQVGHSVEAHLTLARVYLSLNQPTLAQQRGQAALDLDPGNREAQQLIEQGQAGTATSRKTL